MFCFSLMHMQCSLLFVFWVPLLMKHVGQMTLLQYLCIYRLYCCTFLAPFTPPHALREAVVTWQKSAGLVSANQEKQHGQCVPKA